MAIRVGRWDCPACGRIGNLGPEQNCNGCGRPRGPEVRFYLPEEAEVLTGETEIKRAQSGADWTCDYCGTGNVKDASNCRSCGNARTDEDQSLSVTTYDRENVPASGADFQKTQSAAPPAFLPKKKKSPRVVWGIVAAAMILFCILLIPRPMDLTVSGHQWERTIEIEHYCLMRHEDWSVPPGGTTLRSFRAVHHHDQVLDHYETKTRMVRVKTGEEKYVSGRKDLGNGYFEDVYSTRPVYDEKEEQYQDPVYRDVPVYQTKYLYQIYEWVKDRTSTAKGQDQNPRWPEGAPQRKDWRDGAKKERYLLSVQDQKGKQYQLKTGFDRWNQLTVGATVRAKKNLFGIDLKATERLLEQP